MRNRIAKLKKICNLVAREIRLIENDRNIYVDIIILHLITILTWKIKLQIIDT